MNSLLATVNVVTFLPLARLRISGSRVRRPVKRTLFTVRVLLLGLTRRDGRRPCVPAARRGGRSTARPAVPDVAVEEGAGPGGRAIRRVDGPASSAAWTVSLGGAGWCLAGNRNVAGGASPAVRRRSTRTYPRAGESAAKQAPPTGTCLSPRR